MLQIDKHVIVRGEVHRADNNKKKKEKKMDNTTYKHPVGITFCFYAGERGVDWCNILFLGESSQLS